MNKYITSFGGKEFGINRHLLSFGLHRNYTAEVERLFDSAKPYELLPLFYDDDWLLSKSQWANNNNAQKVFSCPSRGWAFKSCVILDALSKMNDGDYLLWVDSNDVLIANPQPIFEFCDQHNVYFHDHWPVYYKNSDWTNRDMFVGMSCDEVKYHNAPQIQVNIMGFKKNEFVISFVEEWAKYSTDYDVMIKNEMLNYPGYREHRHEQSIVSILREKYNMPYAQGYPYGIAREEMGIST